MFPNLRRNTSYTDGPYLQWVGKNELEFIYFSKEGDHRYNVPVQEGREVMEVPGQQEDSRIIYPIKRNPQPQPAVQEGVEKMLVLGDMHGMYRKLKSFLTENGVVDKEGHWCWGRGQLVFCGDIFDRGSEVTEMLWFIYRLEKEAEEVGGAVHYLLGNHELMVMEGDYRYVHRKYLEMLRNQKIEYSQLFEPHTILGQWLRSRNTAIKLNGILICHAGISPYVASTGISLESMNNIVKAYLQRGEQDDLLGILNGSLGPFWYRGYIISGGRFGSPEQKEVEALLAQYNASQMVIAHTTVPTVLPLFERTIFAVDLDVNDHQVPLEGLLTAQGKFYRLKEDATAEEV